MKILKILLSWFGWQNQSNEGPMARRGRCAAQELEKEGTDLRLRAAAMLRGTFGFTSEELIPFGIRPRPRNTGPRKRRKKAETEQQQAGTDPKAA